MLKEALQFADDNDLHFTYNVELKIFYFYKTGLMSDHVKVGDRTRFESEKIKMTQNAN